MPASSPAGSTAAVAIDIMRAVRLEQRGYRIWTQSIPAAVTPKNRLLLGAPRSLTSRRHAESSRISHDGTLIPRDHETSRKPSGTAYRPSITMSTLLSDLRLAMRGLRRSPLFATVAILSLALGIGANTAIFTLIDQVLLRKLPVTRPDELVMLYQQGAHMGSNMGSRMHSYPDLPGLSSRRPSRWRKCSAGGSFRPRSASTTGPSASQAEIGLRATTSRCWA